MRSLCMALIALAGCGGNGNGNGDMPVADLGTGDFARPIKDMSGPCGSDTKIPDGGVCVIDVSGKLVDEAGMPVKNVLTTVCAGTCYFGMAGADGNFLVAIDHYIFPDQFALEIHGSPDYVSYYARLPPITDPHVVYPDPLVAAALPKTGPLIALDNSAQTVTAGDVTLILDAGTEVQLDVVDVMAGDPGRMLRPYTATDPTKYPFVDKNAVPDALYSFAPFEVIFSKGKAHLAFANTGKFAPGTAFDVLSQGGLLSGVPPAGNFTVVATATVSMDGTTIATDQGTGVATLTWIALRKK
jgi:hypothetical protein